ncbi:MAG: flagellar hook-associated protein FlgL [Polyangia bacterium]
MRVTEQMIFNNGVAQAQQSMQNLSQAQNQLSSGYRVVQPGDDPAASAQAIEDNVAEAQYTAIGNGAQQAADELSVAGSALQSVSTAASQALQLATQYSNSTYTASERSAAASQVTQIMQQVVDLMNTTYDGRYVFGGFKDSSPPFAADGSYSGDDNIREVEIAPGLYQAASVDANVIVKGSNGGVDLMTTLANLATALSSNDVTGISNAIGSLNTCVQQIATGTAQVGVDQDGFQSAVTASQAATENETEQIGNLMDADVMTASSQVSAAQYALDATLTATAQTLNMTMSLTNQL